MQACVAAGVNITYKLLYNDVVAMTGAQDAEGALTVAQLTHKLTTEGVKQIIVCADEPKRHNKRALAKGTSSGTATASTRPRRAARRPGRHRADLRPALRRRRPPSAQARHPAHPQHPRRHQRGGLRGLRRLRRQVQLPVGAAGGHRVRPQDPHRSDLVQHRLQLPGRRLPVVRHRRGAARRKQAARARPSAPEPPALPDLDVGPSPATQNVFLAGIGGTGIVTVNQVLATAALRAGYDVESLDQIGLSQKAGPVVSHLRFAAGKLEPSNRLTPGSADCIVAFDLLAAADTKNLGYGDPATTVSVASTSQTPTGDMVYDKPVTYPETAYLLDRLGPVSRTVHSFDALAAAQKLFGNTAAANFLLVGAAYQTGALRLPAEAIEEAIEINGVAVDANIAAFRWGRVAVADPARFDDVVSPARDPRPAPPPARVLEGATLLRAGR